MLVVAFLGSKVNQEGCIFGLKTTFGALEIEIANYEVSNVKGRKELRWY